MRSLWRVLKRSTLFAGDVIAILCFITATSLFLVAAFLSAVAQFLVRRSPQEF